MHEHEHEHHEHPASDDPRGIGDNQPRRPLQWQVPHRPHGQEQPKEAGAEADFDLVEASFVEGFAIASDPTSFLRLAAVPFAAQLPDGTQLSLLRVELDQVTDVGAVTPHLGGQSYRYDPLPAKLVSRRRRLRLIYHDGATLRPLSLAEARALPAA